MADDEQVIGVALSGGGHRASLFGLGALLYLIDAGKGPRLGSVASVSGGSITNAFIGGAIDLKHATPSEMRRHAGVLASQIVHRGTLWASLITYAYLSFIALLVIVAIFVSRANTPSWAIALVWVAATGLVGWLAQRRSAVVAMAFDKTVFHGARLADMHRAVSHVLCATDLQTGQHVYFSSEFVYAWRTGWGTPGDLRASRAAQASAALPGAFSVVPIRLSRFGLPEDRIVAERNPPKQFKLLDGGVYDNMASEWLLHMGEPLTDGSPPGSLRPVTEAIVVNASAGDDVTNRPWVTVPLVGELASLLAVKDVMYRQTTAVRRRLLNIRYQIAQDRQRIQPGARSLEQALPGATVQINRSPFNLPDRFAGGRFGGDGFAERAAAVIAALGEANRDYWLAEADANRRVKTTLSRIDSPRAQSLIRHGYTLTMANCHVLLGYPLLNVPAVEDIAPLVSKQKSDNDSLQTTLNRDASFPN